MSAFCPELQLPWTLARLHYTSLDQIRVVLTSGHSEPPPHTQDRHVSDILSYPSIITETTEAELTFQKCLTFEIRADEAVGPFIEGGEGQTFIRFLTSALLQTQRERLPKDSPLFHYRILCGMEEVVDIVCRTAPVVTLRRFHQAATTRLAG